MAETKMVAPGALDKLAKLLAAENIMVEHRPIKTAYFDVKNRVLALPMWKEMTETLYHMLVLHEVGHALETPADGWKGSIDKVKERDGQTQGSTFQGYLNVVEDARIERKIKTKFPGSRRDFIEGYDWLHQQDFFSVQGKTINDMTLIDRINLYFKIGTRERIMFNDEEQVFVRRAEQTITFAEVIQLAEDIYAYAKAKNEEQQDQQTMQMIAEEGEGEDGEDFEFDHETDHDESAEDGDGDDAEQSEKDKETSGQQSDQSEGGSKSEPMDHGALDAMTDRSMNDRMEELLDESLSNREFQYLIFPKDISYEPYTYSYKKVLGWIEHDFANGKHPSVAIGYRTYLLNNFRRENNNAINYMVKEFEMKKAAVAYSRSKQAKTGVIDTNKLHSYKFNDDIFKRLTIEPTGKNHGVVAILDMSGSMSGNFRGAMDQLICLAMFCRRVGIPHRFYGFTSVVHSGLFDNKAVKEDIITKVRLRDANKKAILGRIKKPFVYPDSDFDMLELFHEDMSLKEFNTMVGSLLVQSTRFGNGYGYSNYTDDYVKKHNYETAYELINRCMPSMAMQYFSLGGTPLNDAILVSRDLLRKFRKEKNIQIMNYICITDGESNTATFINTYGTREGLAPSQGRHVTRIFVDEESRMQTTINFQSSTDLTGMFARVVRDSQDAKFVGFYIVSSSYDIRNAIYRYVPYGGQEKARNAMSKEGSVVIPDMINFHEFYMIRGGKNLEAQQAKFEEAKDMKKGQLARAFISAQNKRGTSRVILGRFIDKIAS
jgi:hypothetical protein